MTDTSLSDATETPQRPPSVDRAFWAAVVWVSLSVLTVLVEWAHRSYVRELVLDLNKHATKKRDYSTPAKLDNAVNSVLAQQLIFVIVLGFLIMLTALQMRRGRSWARWVLLVVAVIPIPIFPGVLQQLSGLRASAPTLIKLSLVATAAAALAVVIFLAMPATSRYFAALRGAVAEGSRPSLFGTMFGQSRRQPAPPPQTSPTPSRRVLDVPEAPVATAHEATSMQTPAAPPARPKSGAKPKRPTGTARSKSRKR
jgi:hypothetical protein